MTANGNEIKFGTDGWRGVIARDFTFENVRKVAQAVADYIHHRSVKAGESGNDSVVIGYDRRFLSEKFALAAAETLKAGKIDVTLIDEVLPTPAVSLLTQKKFFLGMMITASHNPHNYNGVKIKLNGRAAPQNVTAEIESHLARAKPPAAGAASVPRKSFKETYLSYIKSRIPPKQISSRIGRPVIMDCMHGCASGLIGDILPSKKVFPIRDSNDPMFGGINPEPIEKYLAGLIRSVKEKKAAAGIAFDGDADRVGVVDDTGSYMTPCQVFPLLLEYLHEKGKLKGRIVQAVSMGYLSARLAKANNLPFEEVPVGFKFIAEKMLSEDVAMGAEESGGYSWKGNLPERDGILTALLILEMLTSSKKTLSQLYKAVEDKYGKSHFLRRDVRLSRPIPDKNAFAEKLRKKLPKTVLGRSVAEAKTIDGLKVILDNGHWLLMRPSGTEPVLRSYAETDSAQKTREFLELAQKWTSQYF